LTDDWHNRPTPESVEGEAARYIVALLESTRATLASYVHEVVNNGVDLFWNDDIRMFHHQFASGLWLDDPEYLQPTQLGASLRKLTYANLLLPVWTFDGFKRPVLMLVIAFLQSVLMLTTISTGI
jgi:hypothetical protein